MEFYFSSVLLVIFSLCFGSFCNVLIYRIPKGEQFVTGRSYCPNCKHKLVWYDNIPLLSYILLGGKCRYCKNKISIRYPVIELLVTVLGTSIAVYILKGLDLYEKPYLILLPLCYSTITAILVVLSVIDFETYEIPMGCNIALFILGVVITILSGDYINHIIGMICVSGFLALVFFITSGRGIGFGDVKLMFACGLICGWKSIIIGFLLGCILGIIIHSIRMKISKQTHMLAFGPYLSLGVYLSFYIGDYLINLYISFLNSLIGI